MTRKEAINKFRNKVDKQLKRNDFTQDFELLLHEIFDNIEHRTCENCMHFQNKINEEEIACNYHCEFYSLKYKYCGYWESKDD
jgi:hypothetical protein